jgi:hypothetical protein
MREIAMLFPIVWEAGDGGGVSWESDPVTWSSGPTPLTVPIGMQQVPECACLPMMREMLLNEVVRFTLSAMAEAQVKVATEVSKALSFD